MAKPKQNPLPEVQATFRDLLLEQLAVLAAALPENRTLQTWYDDGCDFDDFIIGDDTHREALSFAFGYLRGAHEALDVTMSEMLDEENISMESIQ